MSDNGQLVRMLDLELNTDDDLTLLQNGSRYINNVTFNEDGNSFVASNLLGNTLKTTLQHDYGTGLVFSLPAGTNTTMFSLENKEENAEIAFVYNTSGYHSIYQYYKNTDDILWVLKGDMASVGTVLNFSLTYPIDARIIGNGDDKYLVFTDGYNPPRILNIKMAIDYTKGSGGYTTISAQILSFYKSPPVNVYAWYSVDTTVKINLLQGKLWQFMCRKKFVDGTYSVGSQFSNIPIPEVEHNANGVFNDSYANRKIGVSFVCDENDHELVDKYELLYRVVDVGSGVNSAWYLSDLTPTIIQDHFIVSFTFRNESSGVVVSTEESDRLWDCVPDLAKHVAVIDGSRIVFGEITEGFDNVTGLDVALTHSYEDLSMAEWNDIINPNNVRLGGSNITHHHSGAANSSTLVIIKEGDEDLSFPSEWNIGNRIYNSTKNVWGWIYGVSAIIGGTTCYVYCKKDNDASFDWDTNDVFIIYPNIARIPTISVAGYDYLLTISGNRSSFTNVGIAKGFLFRSFTYSGKTSIELASEVASVDNIGKEWEYTDVSVTETSPKSAYVVLTRNPASTSDDTDFYYANFISIKTLSRYPSFLSGSKNVFALQYFKDGKPFYASYDESMFTIDIPTTSEAVTADATRHHKQYFNEVNWQINHNPPAYATHYQWMYLGSNISSYREFALFLPDVVYDEENADYLKIPISSITRFGDAYNIDYGFEITKGDRIKILGYFAPNVADGIYDDVTLFDVDYDYEILSVTDTHFFIKNAYSSLYSLGYIFDVMVYKLNLLSENTGTYQAISQVYSITGGTHSITSGTFTPYFANCFLQRSAFININNIDSYLDDVDSYTSIPVAICYGWRESESVSPMYDSKISNFGRENIVNNSAIRAYYNKIRWGGLWFDNSGVSYFSKFNVEDEKTLDDANGVITKIEQRGSTLRVYQERKVTSFYLGTTSSIDATGQETYVFSGDVMSDGRPDIKDFGCTHFESFARNVRNSYFFDIVHGAVLRDSVNGVDDISFKFSKYFKDKAKAILDYGSDNVFILGGYDDYSGYYFITFCVPGNSASTINDTVAFDEANNKWRSHYSFVPRFYGTLTGQTIVSFVNGYLYLHNSNATRNNFYGTQYGSEIWIHAADGSNANKIFDSVELTSTGKWSCPLSGDVLITYPVEMQSRLVEGKFKEEDGIYKSEFLRDMLNGGATAKTDNLFNGRTLRGHEICLKLKNTDTTFAALRTVTINNSLSK